MRDFQKLLEQELIYKPDGHKFKPKKIEWKENDCVFYVEPDTHSNDPDVTGYVFDENFDKYFEVVKIKSWKGELE